MPPAEPAITVIIPSRGLSERASYLQRAVETVLEQAGVQAIPLVVLNGARRAPEVESAMRALPGVRVLVHDEANLPDALRIGRAAVDTPWFATLDDDDLLLPGALARRLRELEEHPDADVVVTNGLVRRDGRDTLHVPPGDGVAVDALRALLRHNWLLPGSWLARSDRVGLALLAGMPRYRECTFLALRFSTEYVMRWVQEPTVVYQLGTPHAETQSREYVLGQVEAVRQLLALPLPPTARRRVRWEVTTTLHDAADYLWAAGELGEAWRLHLRTLGARGGLHFLPFTRHLLGATWRRAVSRARGGATGGAPGGAA